MTPVGRFVVDAAHPSLPGHFPGRPVVPGVVLLDRVAALVLAAGAPGRRLAGVASVRFSHPVRPSDAVAVTADPDGRFACAVDGATVAQGRLVLGPLELE